MQLKNAAPELVGQWEIAPYPGVVDEETGEPCLKNGGSFGFTRGGTWKVVKRFEGKSHAKGGIDITVTDNGIKQN